MSLERSFLRMRNRIEKGLCWGEWNEKKPKKIPLMRNKFFFEPLEPRVLLSADLNSDAAAALAGGIGQFGDRVFTFLDAEGAFDTHVPLIVQMEKTGEEVQNVAPTLNSLFAIPADQIAGLDTSGDGKIEAAEFIQGWFFDKVEDVLPSFASDRDGDGDVDTADFAFYMRNDLDHNFPALTIDGKTVTLDFEVEATDLTEDSTAGPVADLVFDVDFTLTVTQYLQLDLGTGADALKLLAFTGDAETPDSPVIPVTTTMEFGFTFGVRTGGQLPPDETFDSGELNAGDFFVRTADDLYVQAESHNTDNVNFHLNIGFLGADVVSGDIDFTAAVKTILVDPDSPDVLGFTTDQYGEEKADGVVRSFNAIPSADLEHDAGFVLRIGNAGIATEVKVSADEDGNPDNILALVQGALNTSGLGGLIEASLDGTNHLVFTLVATTDTPMGFANEVYAADGVLELDPDGTEYTSNQSFLLSIGGSLPTLVNVRFQDPAKTDIGFDANQDATPPELVAQYLADTNGQVSADASFDVRVTFANGDVVEKTVTVLVADTDGTNPPANTSPEDLAADVENALGLAAVTATVVEGRIILVGNASVSAIEITSADSVAEADIGFTADQFSGLTLTAAEQVADPTLDDGIDATNDEAHIEITANWTLKTIAVAPGSANGTALATAIDDALEAEGLKIDAVYIAASNKIVLRAQDASVLSFSIRTVNNDIEDLADDVQRALNHVGIGDDVTVTEDDTNLIFTEGSGKSLEMTKTLTLDAGVTYAELQNPEDPEDISTPDATVTEDLFLPEKDLDASKIILNLPIQVDIDPVNLYNPSDVAIVGNFTTWEPPADSPAWELDPPPVPRYDATPSVRRFDLFFTYTPEVDDQNNPVPGPTPNPATLTEELRLVNLAEPLNFNLITTESMIGLIMGLGTALQEIADSGLFSGYDIPFADASLADLFNFTDADRVRFSGLFDTALIFETGGDGVNGLNDSDKLLRAFHDLESDTWILLPTFYTAQELASRLDALLPNMKLADEGLIPGINANYDTATDELTYELELLSGDRASVGIGEPFTAPFEYDVDLSPFAKLTVDAVAPEDRTEVVLQARTALSMTFGIDLSLPGNLIYPDITTLGQLNGGAGIDIKTEAALTGESSVRAGMLSKDAHFWVLIDGFDPDGNPETNNWIFVTVDAVDTATNYSYQDLAIDINTAIGETAAAGKVAAVYDRAVDRLKLVAPGETLRVFVSSDSDPKYYDTAITELGFAFGESGPGETVYALRSAPIGRLTGDAVFSVSVNGGDAVEVTVAKSATNSNYAISDLVKDVDDALAKAGLGSKIKAGFNISETGGKRLVLTAVFPGTEFTVQAVNVNGIAELELGLPSTTTDANRSDFVIYNSNGVAYNVVLDGLTDGSTVQDLIDRINDATTIHVTAELNASHTGLRLIETNAVKGGSTFRVEKINGTGVLLQLGLTSSGNQVTQNKLGEGDKYRIDGGAIGLTHLDDRFFVRDAEIRLEALRLQLPEATMEYPAGIPGTALFGIVGLQTSLSGSLRAEVSAELRDPTQLDFRPQHPQNAVTLAELFEGGKQGRLSSDAKFKLDIGDGPIEVTVPKIETDSGVDINNSIEDLVVDVNEALEDAGLNGKIVAMASGPRLVLQAVKGSGLTSFTITAGGTAVTELGLPGNASAVTPKGGVPTIEAAAASRYAVEEPVVETASELAYYTGQPPIDGFLPFAGGFTAGQVLIGYNVETWPDSDGNIHVDYTETGRAIILENRYDSGTGAGVLTLSHVEDVFYTAEWLWADGSTAWAYHSPGEVTPRANFGEFNFHVTVQPGLDTLTADGVPTGFGDGFAAIDGKSYNVPIALTGFGNPFDPLPPEADLDKSGLGDLAAFENLTYDDIYNALVGLLGVVQDVTANFELLNTKLPAINKSVGDLLNLESGFTRAVENAETVFGKAEDALSPEGVDLPALRLQDIARALRGAFGLPDGVNPETAGAVDFVKLDFVGNMLMIDLSIHESISTKLGLDIDIPNPDPAQPDIPNITSGGVLQATGSLDGRLNFGIDLDSPEDAYLYDTSRIDAELTVVGEGQEGTGLVFRASLGPLAIFVIGGDALIEAEFSLPGMDFSEEVVPGRKAIGDVVLADFITSDPTADKVEVVLPMFYGGEGPDNYLEDFSAIGTIGDMEVVYPDFSAVVDDINSNDNVFAFDPFENILLGIDTVDFYLEALQDIVSGDILGITLPFVGDQMADVLFIEEFRNILIRTLKSGVENSIDPQPELIGNLLNDLFLGGGPLSKYLKSDIDPDTNWGTDVAGNGTAEDPLPDGVVDFDDLWYWFRQWNFNLGDTLEFQVEDFDLGIPNLGFDIDAPVQVKFTWELDFGFGVDFARGAYIDVSDYDDDGVDLSLQLELSVPGTNMDGWLGFMQLEVDDLGSGVKLDFNVDVKKGETDDPLLGFSDLGNIVADTEVWGDKLNQAGHAGYWDLESTIGGVSALPRMYTDLLIDWSIQTPPTDDNPLGAVPLENLHGDAVKAWIDRIEFVDMKLDGGAIINDILAPILEEIHDIIQPFMPVVDVITAPIPVLSDLAGEPFTILDLAEIFGSVDAEFIETIADILTLIDKISDPVNFEPLDLGDLLLFDKAGGTALFSPTAAPGDANYRLADIDLDSLAGTVLAPNIAEFNADVEANNLLRELKNQEWAKGLTFPILTNALDGIGLLLDQDAVLVDYILPPLAVTFEYLQVFPVWGPLAVSIEISFGFTIDLHSVGFDTFGLHRYADGGGRNPGVIFDGFYLNDLDAEGVDAPEVTFEFGLIGAAELNLGIARAGVGGGIKAKIFFDWNDPIADGRVHISEMVGNLLAAPEAGPLAIFDLGGALTFQLFAFLEISIIGFEQEFPITPETELFSFEVEIPKPPILATQVDGTLILNMGPNAMDRVHGDTSDGHESISLSYVGGAVQVYSSQFGVSGGDPVNTFTGVNRIVGIGGQGNDVIELYGFDGSGITAEFDGGDGDDRIEYMDSVASRSIPGARIIGGTGNDILTGGEGNDTIVGGEGNDTVKGSGGYDLLFGDQGRIGSIPVEGKYLISTRIRVQDGDDTIEGGAGDDVLFGSGGDDILKGDAGDDLIIGDGGRFLFTYADGHIDLASMRPAAYTPPGIETYVDPKDISNGIDAIYDHVVDVYRATDLGFGGNDEIYGGENNDVIIGGSGDDTIQGDAGDDIILGGKGFDTIKGGTEADTIFGGDQADTIEGNEGGDVISGDTGNDYIHGNEGDDVMKGGRGADVIYGDENDDIVLGQSDPDILFGGINDDIVVGGTSNDIMFGDDGLVAKLDPDDAGGDKVIGKIPALLVAGEFRDDDSRTFDLIVTTVVDGDGNDFLSGDAGDDYMLGGGGNDTMGGDVDPRLPVANTTNTTTEISADILIGDGGKIVFDQRRHKSIETIIGDETGAPFDDVIYGDNGNDYIFGGRGSDFLFGGHGKVVTGVNEDNAAVEGFRGATDPGADENDIIIGDNGEILFANNTYGEQFGDIRIISTTDTLNGTGAPDYAEGELGNDVLFGGVNGEDPTLTDLLCGDGIPPSALDGDVAGETFDDVVLGDNGMLHFDYDWSLDVNLTDDTFVPGDGVLDTLDLIRSFRDGLGGIDIVSGSAGSDVLIGGTEGDTMYGDDPTASNDILDGEDIMLGDNADIFLAGLEGRLKVRVAAMTAATAVDLITTTDAIDDDHLNQAAAEACGGPDTMSGNFRADVVIGGVNNGGVDHLYGDAADPVDAVDADILVGDNGLLDFTFDFTTDFSEADYPDFPYGADDDRMTLDLIRSFEDGLGGVDIISGNAGADVAIGGTAGDEIFGDDAGAQGGIYDLADMLLGDNADIYLVDMEEASGGDLKDVLGAAVMTIRTTDEENPGYGGSDIISGNADNDIIAGGVQGDTLYGDALNVLPSFDGDDIILGDNGAFEWLSNGRFSEIEGINISANNTALGAKYGTASYDIDLTTLDLVTTEQPTSGGRDVIYGDQGRDLVFAGTDADTIYGDDGTLDEIADSANNDLLFGDHGRIYPQFSTLREEGQDWRLAFNSRNFFAIDIGDGHGGEGDRMWGEEGDDTMVGQQGDDRMWGGSGDDDMTGGHNVSGGYDELTSTTIAASLADTGIEVPAIDDVNDLMDGGTEDDSMAGDNAIIWRRGDDLSPRFRLLTATSMYTTDPDTVVTNVGGDWQSDPDDAIGRDIQLIDHSDEVQGDPQGRFGSDVMAGGADSDVMFGELANDLMQGDGSIESTQVEAPSISYEIGVEDTGFIPPDLDTTETLYFNIPEATSDADDYMEGNGGNDLMYGGLGQDDIIGGSSELFGLDDVNAEKLGYIGEQLRPDGSDVIFGGAGNVFRLARNDFVGLMDTDIGTAEGVGAVPTNDDPMIPLVDRHSRDADFIMGDNANVFRLVEGGASGTDPDATEDKFLEFNFDQTSTYEGRGDIRIIPRAMEQLDYTLGGSDYWADGVYGNEAYNNGAAKIGDVYDNGLADLIHGESGDDIVFGMTGSDIIFGNSDDDDVIGGYGNDWISGGTGQDGILGDDGLIYTSRNSTAGEPLNGIDGLLDRDPEPRYAGGNVLDETIYTPGQIQYAIINRTDELKKTIELVPFSYDPDWNATDDEFPDIAGPTPYADDIIFGGLGSDWLHGGSGDDAISGAEALNDAYVPVYDENGDPDGVLSLGYSAVALPSPTNPGDVLAFNPEDLDGRHLNNRFRAGEFRLYDEYDPRLKIMLDATGNLWKSSAQGTAYEFLLNFDKTEGVFREGGMTPGNQNQSVPYDPVHDDGSDAIFGDLGNDWLVGGTGRDDMYGGWGNDLLNADDDHDTNTGLNDMPDTHPNYEDRAYGGAGRDVLIANTGGDRLIDWVGEYNSYLVPYAPFGEATVSRTLQPFLPEFLYALSKADGADQSRVSKVGGETARNGEPNAEMGLVLQKDPAWQDQTGAPADPQAGNIPGGKRDVLRTATFDSTVNPLSGFFVDSGSFTVEKGALKVSAESLGKDAAAVFYVDQYVPNYYEVLASISVTKPTAGWKANAYIIFDYYSSTDFKFAGIDISTNKFVMGHRDVTGWVVDAWTPAQLKAGTYYNLLLAVNGTNATLRLNNSQLFSYTYVPRIIDGLAFNLNTGMVGLGSDNSRGVFDNITVQRLAPQATFTSTEDFADGKADLFVPQTGTWKVKSGRYTAEPLTGSDRAISLLDLSSVLGMDPETFSLRANSYLELETIAKTGTTSLAGLVYDYYGPEDFKFVAIKADTDQVIIGHYTSKGWVTDKSFSKVIDAGKDYKLNIAIKGTTVSVTLADQVVGGYTYNSMLVDGGFGLIAANGAGSFDNVTVKTDDPSFTETSDLLASAQPDAAVAGGGSTLTAENLEAMVDAAIGRLADAYDLDAGQVALLDAVNFQVADLGGLILGETSGTTVLIDTDAAGYGWFIDSTPLNNTEFKSQRPMGELTAIGSSPAFGDMDLLTVVMHELGHVLGFEDLYSATGEDSLMGGTLEAGTRYLPGDNGNGTSKPSASLVAMDATAVGVLAGASSPTVLKQNNWLANYLLNGAENCYNSFGINEEIKILLDPKDKKNNRVMSKGL